MTPHEQATTAAIVKNWVAAGKIKVAPPCPNAKYKAPPTEEVLRNRKRALERYRRLAKEYLAKGLTTAGKRRSTQSRFV